MVTIRHGSEKLHRLADMKSGRRQKHKALAYIGTSGFVYKHWANGVFYKTGLPTSKWFEHYCALFSTVELNGTFYKLPKPSVFHDWYQRSPKKFRFFVKGSRFVTHFKHLKDPQPSLDLFFNAVAPLKEKLAGVLWQLPRSFKINAERLREFLAAFREISDVRLVMEFRHPSWFTDEVTAMLPRHDAVYCRADSPEFYEELTVPHTASYAYYRHHGVGTRAYSGGYSNKTLTADAREIKALLRRGMDVFVYFNNDIGGYAPRNALTLKKLIGRAAR
jgi:uncharacterized protein YecE (DUF72 family)